LTLSKDTVVLTLCQNLESICGLVEEGGAEISRIISNSKNFSPSLEDRSHWTGANSWGLFIEHRWCCPRER
jgi:hypothetical protein